MVARQETRLAGLDGRPAEMVPALTILACLSRPEAEARQLKVISPQGREALLPREAGLLLAEDPSRARQRLQRLAAVDLDPPSTLRVLAGRIAENDSPWLVETAWGPPQRRFMVNYFMDEEHFVYLRPGGQPLLLRFKGGRLAAPLPAEYLPAAVERPSTPR